MEKFQTKKSLGQHFLNSDVVPGWMCDAAAIEHGDMVVEIGPGTGALTKILLQRGARVLALEADPRAIAVLEKEYAKPIAEGQLTVLHQDVRTLDVAQLPGLQDHQFKVVASIPYYLSSRLFRTFLQSPLQPKSLVYLVQKEVAQRVAATISRGEKESLLSLGVKVYGKPTYVRTVTKGHFTPPPKVDSAIILVEHINREQLTGLNEERFFHVLRLAFGQKRKQFAGNLSVEFDKAKVSHILSTLNLPLSTRAEDIPSEIWPDLVRQLLSSANPGS